MLNLAKIGNQNQCEDKGVYVRIAELARLLAAKVPEEYWSEICFDWFEAEDEPE